jgi:FdrA protein
VLHSNLENVYSEKLPDHHKSVGHTVLDMGAEDFTAEAPHPVFDPSLRVKRLRQELNDPSVAAVLLDFITGPGVAEDPFTAVTDAIREFTKNTARRVTFIANICGSAEDPQNISERTKQLKSAGVTVAADSGESARMAAALMNALERRGEKT